MPGSFASSPTRLSIADTLERQLEREVHPSSKLRHLGLRQVCSFLLRITNGDQDKVLEHLDVGGRYNRWIDSHASDLSFSVCIDSDHAAARVRGYCHGAERILNFLETTLHLLRLLEDLVEVRHSCGVKC